MTQRPCTLCGGKGLIDLAPAHEQTLRALRRGPATSRQLFEVLCKGFANQSAMCNRLKELRRLGLVSREWFTEPGRGNHGWLYRLTKAGT